MEDHDTTDRRHYRFNGRCNGCLGCRQTTETLCISQIGTTVVPYLTYTKGLSGLPASKASVTATIEPVVAAILGIVLFHESVSMLKLTGIVLVLSSVVVMSRQSEKE